MSDNLKDGAIGALGLLILTGFLHHRAEHAIVHDVARMSTGGEFHASVNGRGLFGLLVGQADSVVVRGRQFTTDGFLFRATRGDGIRANVRRLRLEFADFSLRGIPIKSFTSTVPIVSLDAGRAFFDERIIIRSAGEGTAEASVGNEALLVLFKRKYPQYTNVAIALQSGFLDISADADAFGLKARIESHSRLGLSEGRFVILTESEMKINGKPSSPAFVQNTLKSVNPVFDIEKDLGLGGYFRAKQLEISDGLLTIRGEAAIPPMPTRPSPNREKSP